MFVDLRKQPKKKHIQCAQGHRGGQPGFHKIGSRFWTEEAEQRGMIVKMALQQSTWYENFCHLFKYHQIFLLSSPLHCHSHCILPCLLQLVQCKKEHNALRLRQWWVIVWQMDNDIYVSFFVLFCLLTQLNKQALWWHGHRWYEATMGIRAIRVQQHWMLYVLDVFFFSFLQFCHALQTKKHKHTNLALTKCIHKLTCKSIRKSAHAQQSCLVTTRVQMTKEPKGNYLSLTLSLSHFGVKQHATKKTWDWSVPLWTPWLWQEEEHWWSWRQL